MGSTYMRAEMTRVKSRPERMSRITVATGTAFERIAWAILFLMLFAAIVFYLWRVWLHLTYPYPLDYGEGPILDQVLRLARGGNIYRVDLTQPPYVLANYPPLYYILQFPFVHLVGPALWYGRLISVASIMTTALLVGLTVLTLTKNRIAASASAVTLLAIPYISYWSLLNRVDSLALMLSWTGLFIVVRWPRKKWGLFATGLCLAAAVYTRQTYGLAAPLAAFVWLWRENSRRSALALGAITAGLGLSAFILLNAASNGGFYFSIVTANVNDYRLAQMVAFWSKLVKNMPILLVAGVGLFLLGNRKALNGFSLVAPYLTAAAIVALTIGKVGANVNYFFELSAGLAVTSGIIFNYFYRRISWRAVACSLLAVQLVMLMLWTQRNFMPYLPERRAEAANLLQRLELVEGPVLLDEYMGLWALTGRPLYIEPIGMKHLAANGQWTQETLLEAIATHDFDIIAISPAYAEERWTAEALHQIEQSYQRAELLDGNDIYVPGK